MARHLPVVNNAAPGDQTDAIEPFDPTRDLPKLHEANLDWAAVDCVLADLDDFARPVEIIGRDSKGAAQTFEDIVAARDSLVSGVSQAIQIMYEFADQVWVDTLLRSENGARLLRMADASRTAAG